MKGYKAFHKGFICRGGRMKKKILACVVIIATISMLMIGCTSVNSTDETSDRIDNMFVRVGRNSWLDAWIVYDTETKVMYTISDIPYNKGTMTLLVDEKGKPKLWKE